MCAHAVIAPEDAGNVPAIKALLRQVRKRFDMDVVFVSEFVDGQRVFRHVDASESALGVIEEGSAGPLAGTFCQLIVDGHLPNAIPDAMSSPEVRALAVAEALRVGGFLSVPIVVNNGNAYGTLCCFSQATRSSLGESDVNALRAIADAVANLVHYKDRARAPVLSVH